MKANRLALKLVRSFSIGFTIYSPKLNGFCFDVELGCFIIAYWNRGEGVGFENYWRAI